MRARAFVWLFSLSAAAVGIGCAEEEGVTPTGCLDNDAPLLLYDVGAAGERNDPEVQRGLQAAIDKGCISPIGTARSGDLPPSNTGRGGAPGTAGAPGNAGAAGADD